MTTATTMEVWIVTDSMGEFVEAYHLDGGVMDFTRDRDQAMQTTDSVHAFEVARVAREVYGRRFMRMGLI